MPVERIAMKKRPSKRGSRAMRARSQTAALSTTTMSLLHGDRGRSPSSDAIVGEALCPAKSPRILEAKSHGEPCPDDPDPSPRRTRERAVSGGRAVGARGNARDPVAEAPHAGDRDRGEAPRSTARR